MILFGHKEASDKTQHADQIVDTEITDLTIEPDNVTGDGLINLLFSFSTSAFRGSKYF